MGLQTASNTDYLPGQHRRARWLRFDAARILKRYFFCERALIKAQSAWIASIADLGLKLTLPEWSWQDAMTAHALRERVFELRYPSRLMEVGDDAPVVDLFGEAIHAPGALAFVLAMARVFKPALLSAYDEYLSLADELSDGPVLRALRVAVAEKSAQVAAFTRFAQQMARSNPAEVQEVEAWVSALGARMLAVGGLSVTEPVRLAEGAPALAGRRPYRLPGEPARDPAFHRLRFYWPDVVDPSYPYGEGIQLQLRSAVSHLNEVWAVESGGAVLYSFADDLEWEFIHDAARWTYDEARHTRMGYERLATWGFSPEEIPVGDYIYASARGQDPIVRLGMLHYFETKNIGKKTKRAAAFGSYQDRMSQHDMDFDWADETIHAEYGHRWLEALHQRLPERVPGIDALRTLCDDLVAAEVASATDADRAEIRAVADRMVAKATARASDN